jgi:hypothetical protein
MRGIQQKCGTLERELDSPRQKLERKRPELDGLRNESAHSGRELAKETETNRALRAQVDRLQIGPRLEADKQARDAEIKMGVLSSVGIWSTCARRMKRQ